MQILINQASRIILAYGAFSAEPDDPAMELVELDEEHEQRLLQPGVKILQPDGSLQIVLEPPKPLTLEEAKQKVQMEIKSYATNLRDRFIAPLSPGEAASWLRKEEEAVRFQRDGIENDAPFLQAEALVRGVSLADLAAKVMENAVSLKFLETQIAGTRGRHDDAIAQLTTVEAVLTYDWSTGWIAAG